MSIETSVIKELGRGGEVVDPPHQNILKVIWLSSRPWSVATSFFFGLFIVPSLDILAIQVVFLFLWFDFSFNLLNNGLNDIVDYELDHAEGDQTKKYYKTLGGWGHAVHRTQFRQLLLAIVLLHLPIYIYGFYTSPELTLALLGVTIVGNAWFNGLIGFPHANRNAWKNVSEYWIIAGVWLWRAVVMEQAPIEQLPYLLVFLLIYHHGQFVLDYYDLDKDKRLGKYTLVVKMGRESVLGYLSILRIFIVLALFVVYPSYFLLAFNLVFVALKWRKEDSKAGMLFTFELFAIWLLPML